MIPYCRQEINEADIDAVVRVLRSDFLTQGCIVPQFEKVVADYCVVQHGVAVNSATSALHIACLALGLGQDDYLWTVPNTFVASANSALYCGAKVDFVDIDPHTCNMSVECLREKLQLADQGGKLPKIVMPVHFAGQSCAMAAIQSLSQKYGFKIIEDASHAIGAKYLSKKVGSCTYSDITVFSFHPAKIITTGEGGMVMTNDEHIADKLRRLRAHGVTNDKDLIEWRPDDEIWNYQQIELGFNYRITDIQAALGLSQMSRLESFVECRHEIARLYDLAFKSLPITLPCQSVESYSSYHLYPIRVDKSISGKLQRDVYDRLRRFGVAANLHYIPVHRHPFYERLGFAEGDFPEAEKFHKEVISLPIYTSLGADQHKVISYLQQIFSNKEIENL